MVPQKPTSTASAPKKTKTLGQMKKVELKADPVSVEAALWGGQDTDHSLEMSQSALESRLAQLDAGDEAVTGENHVETSGEHSGEKRDPGKPSVPVKRAPPPPVWKRNEAKINKATRGTDSVPGSSSGPTSGPTAGSHSLKRTALQKPDLTGASLSSVSAQLGPDGTKLERSPDAYSLLREAKEAGVFFREDSMREGHTEEAEDPELAAAVEALIRVLFGVRGILRVGPGKNEKNESIVIVVASHGFSDASLASVPEKVHRFRTVIAIPFELLPLRRDR